MKKDYPKPSLKVVEMRIQPLLSGSGNVEKIDGNTGDIGYGGGGHGSANSRFTDGFDEEEDGED